MRYLKAFDCLPHELLIAKLAAYGVERQTLELIYSYLKGRKQTVLIKGKLSKFLEILAGVPQGSILGPILFGLSALAVEAYGFTLVRSFVRSFVRL